ncbi:hypothetical protein SDC9_183849 [bioreactor metagenome]|uniref:Uncharacterized protein n=1 Tax=bioreactor metagenome TaxID=1076179 RepID=A0A645HC90_9ZZZZ
MKLTYPEMIDKVDLLKTKRSPSAQDALNEMREASRERIEERLR